MQEENRFGSLTPNRLGKYMDISTIIRCQRKLGLVEGQEGALSSHSEADISKATMADLE